MLLILFMSYLYLLVIQTLSIDYHFILLLINHIYFIFNVYMVYMAYIDYHSILLVLILILFINYNQFCYNILNFFQLFFLKIDFFIFNQKYRLLNFIYFLLFITTIIIIFY